MMWHFPPFVYLAWQYACDQISQAFAFRICKLQAIQKVEVWHLVIATQHLSSLQYIILSSGCGQRWEQNLFSAIKKFQRETKVTVCKVLVMVVIGLCAIMEFWVWLVNNGTVLLAWRCYENLDNNCCCLFLCLCPNAACIVWNICLLNWVMFWKILI